MVHIFFDKEKAKKSEVLTETYDMWDDVEDYQCQLVKTLALKIHVSIMGKIGYAVKNQKY